eukprot:CAMPEP_0206528808 /NCGR_PEP_ID=MMETSP0325_2-20121206/2205_1 /ASSEMBLY_ACC=CAM_ASM_000347 /TAXON_ID=2866 /ORGANISM="Crypthecodinium cohnii, Strain Seligo" /LENGTH=600 /DNA_ID=CAMNT_0054024561 /DNA_START=88 /DNA_END=1886 /DNA_ORIENTATION=-
MPTLGLAKPVEGHVRQVDPPEDGHVVPTTSDGNGDSNSNADNAASSTNQPRPQPPLPPPVASSASSAATDSIPLATDSAQLAAPALDSEISALSADAEAEDGEVAREGKAKTTVTSGVTSATRGDADRSLASVSEATSPARATSTECGPLWKRLRKLNRGCAEGYIAPPSDSGLRIKHFKGSSKSPGEQLEAGLMVRYFHTDRSFEHRILKTDKRRSFLYLLKHTDSNAEMDPVVIRTARITQVLGGEEGLAAFYANAVRDPHLEGHYLNAATAVLVSCAEPGETPSQQDLTFLLAPPQSKLKWILTTVMAEAASQKDLEIDDTASRRNNMTPTSSAAGLHQSKTASIVDVGTAPASVWWRLEGCRVQNLGNVLRENGGHLHTNRESGVELELRLRGLDEDRRAGHRVHYVKYQIPDEMTYCRPEAIAGSCKKGFTAIDSVRLQLALLEIALFHRWGQTAGQHFNGDLYKYLTQPADQSRESPHPLERDMINEAIPDHPLKMDQLETYCRPALKSAVSAMVQLLDLEDNYFAVKGGRLYKLNALAGADHERDLLLASPEAMQQHDDFAQQAANFLEKLQSVSSPNISPVSTRRSAARSSL